MSLSTAFPGHDLSDFQDYLLNFARQVGIERMRLSDHLPSTRKALAITEFARANGQLDPLREAVMLDYWQGALDLEDDVQLSEIAGKVGLDVGAAREAGHDPQYLELVDALRHEARALGVTGIPSWVLGDARSPALVGCQPDETVIRLAVQAGARLR